MNATAAKSQPQWLCRRWSQQWMPHSTKAIDAVRPIGVLLRIYGPSKDNKTAVTHT